MGGGRLTILLQDDGDVIIQVREDGEMGFGQDVEFCSSGGQSHRTLNALRDLYQAMLQDEEKRPHKLDKR